MKRVFQILSVVAALSISTVATANELMRGGTDEDYAAIQTIHQSIIDHYNNHDVESFLSAYTGSAWHISMRRPIARGSEELATFFGPNMSRYEFQATYELLDLEVAGDMAYMIGRTSLLGTPRVDDPVNFPEFVENRIYTAIFRNVEGQWLIHRYMESTSPRPGEPIPMHLTPAGMKALEALESAE